MSTVLPGVLSGGWLNCPAFGKGGLSPPIMDSAGESKLLARKIGSWGLGPTWPLSLAASLVGLCRIAAQTVARLLFNDMTSSCVQVDPSGSAALVPRDNRVLYSDSTCSLFGWKISLTPRWWDHGPRFILCLSLSYPRWGFPEGVSYR